MRNLRNIKHSIWRAPDQDQVRCVAAAAWDLSTDSVVCAYGPSENDALIELVRVPYRDGLKFGEKELITSWDSPSPNPDLLCDKILDMHYFSDTLTACLVLAGGDIVVVREEPMDGEGRIEIVGSVEAGISAARWSPDEELLAICTKADTFLYMTRTFEGIVDVTLTPEDLKVSEHVSVGWGKRETQFQGKGAKAMRDPTVPEKFDSGVLSSNDDLGVEISWRGDGAYVAVSRVETGSRRVIRVYSREGVLDSVSEPVDGLEGALSWRPAGNLMAGVQRFSDHADIVFFERNGLRHGQFSLRLSSEELTTSAKNIKLSWNHDSTVLAVLTATTIQLWTMGNYHWYLKQEVIVSEVDLASALHVKWHPEKALRLMCISQDQLLLNEYVFHVARGLTTPPHDLGAVAVIDGRELKLTPFRTTNIPPPMALHEVSLEHNIIDVAFDAPSSAFAVLHHRGIAMFGWDIINADHIPPKLVGQYLYSQEALGNGHPTQICYHGKQTVVTMQPSHDTKPSQLRSYHFPGELGTIEEQGSDIEAPPATLTISSYVNDGNASSFAQTASGIVKELGSSNHDNALELNCSTFLPWVELIQHGDSAIAFGVSETGQLYANSRLLVKNCTSFIVTPAHLIFTTTTHLLKFVHLNNVDGLEIPPDDPENDERCRSIERGARLVTAMPSSMSVVLQMPRGNVETIWPRAMVLAGIRKLVEEKNYKAAFAHCRTQRVDMNILYDHAPEQFMANVELFVTQVKKITYIDLFISSLRDEDTTQTIYKETVKRDIAALSNGAQDGLGQGASTVQGKVNRICDALLKVLASRTSTNLQNIITANVCKVPPALDDGLLVVAGLMGRNRDLAEKAVEHICFLADVNKLYDTALGMYNLDLALLVAQQSQKDPREYLPFLQKLQEMPETRRYFSIDDHLGRHEKALTHLFKLSKEDHTELEHYTIKHSLYKQALALYRYQPAQLDAVMALYATYLEANSQFFEAAVAYEYLRQFEPASACYKRAGPSYWRESVSCAAIQEPALSQQALTQLANSLAESLIEAKDFASAAEIYATYLQSIPTAVSLLCRGYKFAAALQLASQHSTAHPDLLTPGGTVDSGLVEALSSTTELLAECKGQLLAQVPRIRELRQKATEDPLAFYEGEVNDDLPDDVSVAASSRISTSASLFTRYTGRQSAGTAATGVSRVTSKNRRREERKRARGKKGTIYEEEYLVASVGRLLERVESVRDDIKNLIIGLTRRRMRERAHAVEDLLAEVVEMCKTAVKDVYEAVGSPGVDASQQPVDPTQEAYRPVGGEAVLAESIAAGQVRKVAPIVRGVEKLSLLGN